MPQKKLAGNAITGEIRHQNVRGVSAYARVTWPLVRTLMAVDDPPDLCSQPPQNDASHELLAAVYEHLRAIARERMSAENSGHTLQATALVHEAFLRIGAQRMVPFKNRAHFFATAAEAMRRILIDHARAKGAAKRGGGAKKSPISVADLAADSDPAEIMALDEALARLEQTEPEVAGVVRMRFFAGLSGDDTAEALGMTPRQVDRHWAYARAWLQREMKE